MPGCQAAVAVARGRGSLRIDPLEVVEHRRDRRAEAVDVQPMKGSTLIGRKRLIVGAQPVGELHHLDVAPHPAGEPRESAAARWARSMMPDIAIDPCDIRPVRLDGNDVEVVMPDQLPGDGRARPVELGRAVGRFAQQDHARLAEAREHRAEFVRALGRRQRLRRVLHGLGDGNLRILARGFRNSRLSHGAAPPCQNERGASQRRLSGRKPRG